jgi:hypothetical protein
MRSFLIRLESKSVNDVITRKGEDAQIHIEEKRHVIMKTEIEVMYLPIHQ